MNGRTHKFLSFQVKRKKKINSINYITPFIRPFKTTNLLYEFSLEKKMNF